ncbi:tectonic-1 isoform X2 [Hemicordylus capensis]|uniref:tectonic-1 isoform X2 n=1 Tax=Hemicordylus capensis TaxID=884348 RepID=UPI002303DEC4|nr:tectonic-1 isoform X2 [Hemicordylus capensis]
MEPGSPRRRRRLLLVGFLLLLLLPASQFTAVLTPAPAAAAAATPEPPTWATGRDEEEATTPEEPEGGLIGSGAPTAELPPRSLPGPSRAPPAASEESPTAAGSSPGPRSSSPLATASPRTPSSSGPPETTTRPGPWPAPVVDVAKLCVCDLLVDQCDVNCCCDPVCTPADFSLFTACSVPVVTGDSQLCRQQEALYSIDLAAHPPQRRLELAEKVNPSIFCIQTANYQAALSFQLPEIPTSHNFDRLLQESGGAALGTQANLVLAVESETQRAIDANETSRYEFKDPIQTLDGFLKLPAPLIGSQCADSNPAGFLLNQAVKCIRMLHLNDCSAIPALSMGFYTNSSILAVPKSSQTVKIAIQSITRQAPGGLLTRLPSTEVLLHPTLQDQSCINVVFEASYFLTFTEAGEITSAAVSFVLGTVNQTTVSMHQNFAISFLQAFRRFHLLSLNSAFTSGVIQSANDDGQLTMMKSTSAQDCLAVEGVRTPVLFGYNMMSGCQLRVTKDADCSLLAPALLNILKGQNFPDCVASFGNSLPQNGPDWVQVYNNVTKPSTCEIPVSFEVEVKWTKYGSLVNPQAKIVSVTATVQTSALPQVKAGSETTIQIMSVATFTDISAAAEPGYKARPTIEAKLPFDFFFPFV